ncbi:unnamed protein product [Cunninghamella blakesleeana]
MSQQKFCVITNVDSLVGYALAYNFLEKNKNRGEGAKLRVLCRNKEGLEKLGELGAEVREIDYNQENQVRECFKNVKAAIMVPEHDRQMVQFGENVFKAGKNENIEHLCMVSVVGADRIQGGQFERLNHYRELENKHHEMFGKGGEKGSIIRISMVDQIFYYLAPMIEGQNVLRLPIKKEQKWSPVDLRDIVEAIVNLAEKNREHGTFFGIVGGSRKEMYQLAPDQVQKMDELAHQIGKGLGHDQLRYEQMNKDEMRQWLQKMRDDNRFKGRPSRRDNDSTGQDKPHLFPVGRYLNDDWIELLLEIWELASQGKLDMTSNELKEILNHRPTEVEQYFRKNREQFRDLK